MKKTSVIFLSGIIATMAATTALATTTKSSTSPFTDNITVSLINYPANDFTTATYTSDNGVNIQGPTYITSNSFPITISSQNTYQNGNPSVTLSYTTTNLGNQQCTLNFVDGPWADLAYQYGTPPSCQGIIVSAIANSAPYTYNIAITWL
ncbi:MAG: hypothetical protein A3I77_04120 [Gammaproteobacteria bacterium RIFCSPLOWO2_02_FULL_42_14]|nr:MAG: hypothetical protein A3B71_05420 [Gammaproteobacteria bacterium RIFCSPHIGHO2_02_FULL_42_43]OGT28393.1 MAG: hypothetical protein A2624_04470 [Gammaproteobacteria bacterium RIFCSPHIGHO2_01_FULL_42_8]OGT51436.1 MAG: hypothetical protein A3E54_05185 [Gammaproteobacteria bacterium RIFCSPHIGHO2_12_FULL_41_25]OGT62138.1 MAG: hypothetical protein A3I77_04120 [Gammaproteobacteria bacterium RIFCSPLOWO2_02_FULL_42_14]OGT85810.1 MAG: hypothetical protein A3G86_03810 [Gammaproteobacteria bacterium R